MFRVTPSTAQKRGSPQVDFQQAKVMSGLGNRWLATFYSGSTAIPKRFRNFAELWDSTANTAPKVSNSQMWPWRSWRPLEQRLGGHKKLSM